VSFPGKTLETSTFMSLYILAAHQQIAALQTDLALEAEARLLQDLPKTVIFCGNFTCNLYVN
jgi:hypothetical protein